MGLAQRVQSFFDARKQKAFGGGFGSRAYEGGRTDVSQMASWFPGIGHPDAEINMTRDLVVARARDLARNNPNIAGAVNRLVEMVVGPNIMYVPKPNIGVMGLTEDWEDEHVERVEAWFDLWATDSRFTVDASRQMNFGGLTALAYRHYVIDGEACGIIKMVQTGGYFRTCIQVIDPDRLSNPHGVSDGMIPLGGTGRVYGGVEVNENGAPIAYHIRARHLGDMSTVGVDKFRWIRVRRFGPTGRPQFVHVFNADRAQQRRGVSRLAALIRLAKISEKHTNATLDTAILANFLAVSVQSEAPTAEVRDALAPNGSESDGWSLEKMVEYRSQNKVRLDGPQILHTLPGETTQILSSNHPNDNFVEFDASLERKAASSIGLSQAQYGQNYAGINFSSGRLQGNETWRAMLHERQLFTQGWCTPIQAAWMEEAVLLGHIEVPGGWEGFYKWRAAFVQADWMGPGRGSGNPLQEANAADINTNAGRTNLMIECAEAGRGWRDVISGERKVMRARDKMGLPPIVPMKAVVAPQQFVDDNGDPVTQEGLPA